MRDVIDLYDNPLAWFGAHLAVYVAAAFTTLIVFLIGSAIYAALN